MKNIKLIFLKKLLARSWFLRILFSHIVASYLAMPLFMLVLYRVHGKTFYGPDHFLLAPCYVPLLMLQAAASVLVVFPFFDVMPPLSPHITIWLSYIVFFGGPLWLMFRWAKATKRKLLAAGTPARQLFGLRTDLWILFTVLAALVAYRVGRSRAPLPVPDIKLAYIPAGEFMMGSASSDYDPGNVSGKRPQHKVRISKGFNMGVTEVTQAQWRTLMGYNPSEFRGDDLPVENVSWYGAVRFCKKLSRATGKRYRLPTEAEWEYACRAGTQTAFCFGDDPDLLGEYAWWAENSEGRTHPVGQKKPNAFGLYDMHGNVEEWCSDLFYEEYYAASPSTDPENTSTGIFRVLRGGSYLPTSFASYCRCAAREATYARMRDDESGFRIVMEAD
jgi:formylglycine-generating enzyme required for sulfatase activity